MCDCHFLVILYHFPMFCICQKYLFPPESIISLYYLPPPLECKLHRARILSFLFNIVTSVP